MVKVGALINDIQQLDLQTKSYAVDLYSSLHVQGQFNSNLAIDDYPFDDQKLIVAIEDKSKDESELVYVPDDVDPIAVSPDITIPGWTIEDPFMDVISNQYPTTFGEPEVSAATYSRAIFGLEVTRPAGTYSLKLLLPMLLVALTAALALSVHPQYVEGRIGIGITALLTLVALQLTSDSGLPDVNNLILLDKLYILSYVFVVLTMAVIVKNSWVDATGDIRAATRADRRGLVLLTAGYFVSAALILVINLA